MRNPKAPAPPRISQPDGYEVRGRSPASSSAPRKLVESIEPEGFEDDEDQGATRPALADEAKKALDMAAARRKSLSPIVERDAPTAAMNPNEYHTALAQLQRQRQGGAAAPAPPPSSRPGNSRPPLSNQTGPNRPLSIKELASDVPSARDLASSVRRSMASIPPPTNTGPPPPPVVVDDPNVINALLGGSAAPINTPTGPSTLGLKPSMSNNALGPQRTPLPLAVVGGAGGLRINTDRPGSIPSGNIATPKTTPQAQAHSRPPGAMGAPMGSPMGSRPPGAMGAPMGSRPPGSAGGPKQYDFARWSSPEISEMPNDGAPVTFQVYTAQDVAQGRGPMRSMPMIEPAEKKPNIGTKIALAVVGGIVVLLTAAAVIMASSDDPKKDPSVPSPSVSAPPSVGAVDPAPPPAPIVIGDPPPTVLPEDPAPSATTGKKVKPPKPAPIAEPRVEAPAPKGGVTPPPNPYGSPGK